MTINRDQVFIIAEAGVNHNGSISVAKKMIDAAADAKVDAIKFQTFIAENVISRYAEKADYQKEATGNDEGQLAMVKKLQLSFDDFMELKKYCELKGVMFLSTPFDLPSVDFLSSLNIGLWKIPSGEITNRPYLRRIGALREKVILSTGMSDMREIGDALDVLVRSGTPIGNIIVLQCNTEYPTPFEDVHLRAMLTIKSEFGVKVGYSDHTLGVEIPIAAVALGAKVIEKHFTLDRSMVGPDHKASLVPSELNAMVRAIRNVEAALGSEVKKPSASEVKNIKIARKSIVAAKFILKGELFTEENLAVKRPGGGICPMKYYDLIGKPSPRDFTEDELIRL